MRVFALFEYMTVLLWVRASCVYCWSEFDWWMALNVRQSVDGFVLWLIEVRWFSQFVFLFSVMSRFISVFRSTMASSFCGVRGCFLSLFLCFIRLIVWGVRLGLCCFRLPEGVFGGYGLYVVSDVLVGWVRGCEYWWEVKNVFEVFSIVRPVCLFIVGDGFPI